MRCLLALILAGLLVPALHAQMEPVDCGFENPPEQCAEDVLGECSCGSGSCAESTRMSYPRPPTFAASTSPCAMVIVRKTTFCYRYNACLNSAGEPSGSCAQPYLPGFCVSDENQIIEVGTFHYVEETGFCTPQGCV